MKNYILVTGGCGYIGGQTAITLAKQGYNVLVLDKKIRRLNTDLDIEYIEADLQDLSSLEGLKAYNIDAVLHFAAFIEVGLSTKDPIAFYQNNIGGTINLLDYMAKNKIKNLVFSSTAASYGNPPADKADKPLSEELAPTPINPYGTSKVMVETLIQELQTMGIINPIIFRYFNASGADLEGKHGEEHEPETHLIPLIFDAANKARANIKMFGDDYNTPDGTCIRDYIHIQDLADVHVIAAKKLIKGEQYPSPIFNLGNGFGYSVKEVISQVKLTTGLDFPVITEGRRQGDPAYLVADNTKVQKVLGWKPKYSSLDNIVSSHHYYLKHKEHGIH
jgi:UDP-glucose 4-epimerase